MLEKLARSRSRLGPKLRAHARARLCLGFQCLYSLGARDFGARPIPSKETKHCYPIPCPRTRRFELNVNVYLSSSWRSELSDAHKEAEEVLRHASLIFKHPSLDKKIKLQPSYIDLYQDHPISPKGLESFSESIPSQYLKIGTLHMLLTNSSQPTHTNTGLSRISSICGNNNRLAAGIVRWSKDVNTTAQTFAHVAAHPLGIYHDFQSPRHRDWTCGPGKREDGSDNQIMNYGSPRSSTWSKCSNHDFKDYYARVVATKGKFCLLQVISII